MKSTTRLLCAVIASALSLLPTLDAAPLLLPEADLFYTSFESDGTPPYSPGMLRNQNGWVRNGTLVDAAGEVVVGGTGGYPSSPDGSQMVRLVNALNGSGAHGGSPIMSVNFASEAVTDKLYFSGVTGFSGTITEETKIISRMYLNNSSAEWMGVIVGIQQDAGKLRFFYTQQGNTAVPTSFGAEASADAFYRFEVDVDIAGKSYAIRVYDSASDSLLASADDGAFRNNTAVTMNYLRINNLSNFPTTGDQFVTYYDQLWISTQAIPESSSLALIAGGAAIAFCIRRRSFVAKVAA